MNKSVLTVLLLCACSAAFGQLLLKRQSLESKAVQRTDAVAKATATDTFTRADINPIDSPMSDGVSTWISGPGALTPVSIVLTNANGTANFAGAIVDAPDFADDHSSKITLDASSTTSATGALLRIKSSSDADGYLVFLGTTTAVQVYKINDTGTIGLTQIGTDITVTALGAGDSLEGRISGSATVTIGVYRNGVFIDSRTDSSSPYTTGQPGIYMSSGKRIGRFDASDL